MINLIRKLFFVEKEKYPIINNEKELYDFITHYSFVRTVIGKMEYNPFDEYCVTRVYFKKDDISSDLCVWLVSHPKSLESYKCVLEFGSHKIFNDDISKQTHSKILEYLKNITYESLNTLEDAMYLKNKYLK